jgi:hypothetical protein
VSCPHEVDVGAYVLDALEPEERSRMRGHLADCPVCTASLRDLEGLPRWLAQVSPPAALPDTPVPSELAYRRFQRSATGAGTLAAPRRPARRWFLAVAAAAVVMGAAGVTGVVVATSQNSPTTITASAGPVRAQASLAAAGQGTSITLALEGVTSGQRCELVTEDRDGRWATAGEWTVNYHGDVHFTAHVPIQKGDIRQLVVRTLDGRKLVSLPV